MSLNKPTTIELKPGQIEYLKKMAKKYDLEDESKAVRCLINFAIEESAREKEIFEEVRCLDC